MELDGFLRAINAVRAGLIRVDADEATYALHIVLRFELEVRLVEGDAGRRRPAGRVERGHAASCSA